MTPTDEEILDELTRDLPRRPMTERDRAVFDEYKRRRAAGERLLTQEEWERRRSPQATEKKETDR